MRLPAFLNLHRLEGRIVALFLGLLIVVQAASFGLIRASIDRNAEASIATELMTGERVFRRLLSQQAIKLHAASELLAKDYGFKNAVGLSLSEAGAVETIKDALSNQGDRIGASLVAYFTRDLKLVAGTRDDAALFTPSLQDSVNAQSARETGLHLIGGRAYQVVAVEVRTPAPVGWVLMAFELDQTALNDLKALSDLLAMVVAGAAPADASSTTWRMLTSNLDAADAAEVSRQIGQGDALVPADVGGEHVRGRFVSLLKAPDGQQLAVVLMRSFDAAVDFHRRLQWVLLGLTVLGVAVFLSLSILLARSISGPITDLSAAARRLERGDYETPVSVHSQLDEVGKLGHALESMRAGIRRRDAQVMNLAYVDQLTQLPNRARFAEILHQHLEQEGAPGAILMLNLDRFKRVNDVLGHEFGDRLLQSVAERLLSISAPAHALLARLTGDEFVILMAGTDALGASQMAVAILKDFEQPLRIDEETIDLGAGIGIALFPEHGSDMPQLMARAELAMYAAKAQQCGSLVYHAQLDSRSQESLSLMSELRQAVEAHELRLYLQPKVDLQTRQVIGAEALVRWQHPKRGLVPPMQFIPFAEQTGFIRTMTAWVIQRVVEFSKAARDAGHDLRLSVNLSTRDLMDQDLPAKIEAMLRPSAVVPAQICLEITESAIMDDPARALGTLEHLSAMGFKLSIDDFGTGYSSLAYLKRLPVDELKIDKSFVMAMERDLDDARIVRSTIELAHNLGKTVVAEGLESASSWNLLAALGCDEGQGFYIAKPMPADEFLRWAQAWRAPDLSKDQPNTILAKLS